MRIYPSERRLRRYVEQDDEEGFPRGGSRAKGRRRVTVQRASATRSRVHARVVKRVLPSLSVYYHYARRPYKSRPAYRGHCHKLELTRQSYELTPGHTSPRSSKYCEFCSLQVLLQKLFFRKPFDWFRCHDRFAVALI